MEKTKVSVVIVARNEARNIENCVGGIYRQAGNWEIDVVLVDSSSTDGTPDLARKWPVHVEVIRKEDFHHGKTRNLGASLTKGDYLVFLQGDAWAADEHWLENLLAPFAEGPHVAATYGRQIPKEECDPVNRFRTRWNYQEERIDKTVALKNELGHRLYFFSTANCAIRREVWEKYRFPEDIRIFEDTTFARRVIDDGATIVYTPTATVVHSHNLGPKAIFQRYLDMGYVQRKYGFMKNLGGSFRSEGMRYLKKGLAEVGRDGGLAWRLRFMWHTFVGYVGLSYGRFLHWSGKQLH